MYCKDFLRYRKVWLGVGIIWIVLFHCPLDFGPVHSIKSIGYGGVDICFFASGIGCFYSLSADPDIINFMKRRLKRLAPTYLVFMVFWLAYQGACGNFGFQMALGNLLALQNFTDLGQDFNWYISAIFLFYLLAPYFKIIAGQTNNVRRIAFLAFLVLCSIPFWTAGTYIITITRLPIFFIGMVFADMCRKEQKIAGRHTVGLVTAFLLGATALIVFVFKTPEYLWSHGLYWYPFILITPPLCIGVSCVAGAFEGRKAAKPIISLLSLCGDYSFELYLVHVLLVSCTEELISAFHLTAQAPLVWALAVIPLAAGCFALRRLTGWAEILTEAIRIKAGW